MDFANIAKGLWYLSQNEFYILSLKLVKFIIGYNSCLLEVVLAVARTDIISHFLIIN